MNHVDQGDQARCQFCDKVFLNEGYLQKHVLRNHPGAVQAPAPEPAAAPASSAIMPTIPESPKTPACPVASTPAPAPQPEELETEKPAAEPAAPVWRSYSTLAQAYTRRGKYLEALECYCKALAEIRELFGDQDTNVADTYQNMGGVFYAQGKHSTAVDYFGKALRIHQAVLGIPSRPVWRTHMNMATAYAAQRRCADALACLDKALEACSPEKISEKLQTLRSIAEVHMLGKNHQEALDYFQKLLAAQQEVYGRSHADVGRTHVSIARVFDTLGEREQALERYRKAMAIERKAPRASAKYSQLASLFAASTRYGDAICSEESKASQSDVEADSTAPGSSAGEQTEADDSTSASSPLPQYSPGMNAGARKVKAPSWPPASPGSCGVEILEV